MTRQTSDTIKEKPNKSFMRYFRQRKITVILLLTCIFTLLTIDYVNDYYHRIFKPKFAPYITWLDLTTYKTIDEKGIPTVHYRQPRGERKNPVTVCQTAMTYWEQYMTFPGSKLYPINTKEYFLHCANWLIDNSKVKNNTLVWEYDFAFAGLKPPWISSMAQGHAMQVLTRAFRLTQDKIYIEAASKALEVFYIDIPNGGVRIIDDKAQNLWWYAEYPSIEQHPKTLNGMLYALLGIHEYYLATGNERAKIAFDNGIRAVSGSLEKYDMGHWSRYDLKGIKATYNYHHIHINQLRRLYQITQLDIFKNYADKWNSYKYKPAQFFRVRKFIFTDIVILTSMLLFCFLLINAIAHTISYILTRLSTKIKKR